MKIVIELPSKNEALITVITMALFLLLTGVFIGLRSEHFLMVALYLVLFFAGLPTRKLALALLPFAIFRNLLRLDAYLSQLRSEPD